MVFYFNFFEEKRVSILYKEVRSNFPTQLRMNLEKNARIYVVHVSIHSEKTHQIP